MITNINSHGPAIRLRSDAAVPSTSAMSYIKAEPCLAATKRGIDAGFVVGTGAVEETLAWRPPIC